MVGHGISAVGAAGVAVGSGIALSGLIAGSTVAAAATGVGLVIALIGAGLVAIGSVLAAWLTDNAYEEFAEHSFLGKSADAKPQSFKWGPTEIELPADKRKDEMRVLTALLSNFRTNALSWDSVSIFPGYYQDGDKFELYVHHRYNNFKLGPLKFCVEIDLTSGDIRQTEGNRPLADSSYVLYDDTGRVKEIKVMIKEGNPRPDLLLLFKSQMMWVRLISKDGFTVPPRDAASKNVWHTSDYRIGSFNTGNTSGSSLDQDYHAVSENNPPLNGLEEIK